MRARPASALALVLLLSLAAQSVHLASFEIRRILVRKQMKERIRQGLPDHMLAHFTFTKEEYEALEKEDGGREFWIGGRIHDEVRRFTDPTGLVHVDAVDDREEGHLMAGLGAMLGKEMRSRGFGPDRARGIVAVLACAMPERPCTLDRPFRAAFTSLAAPGEGGLREGAAVEVLRPPRG